MRKFDSSSFLRNFFLFSALLAFMNTGAQTPQYFKGPGTSGNTIPMNTAGSHTQQIYQPADFNQLPISGLITKIYFRNSVANGTGTYSDFSVSFLQNNLAAFPNNTFLGGFTTALSAASITINGNATSGGWYEIPLATPFLYDNTQTLIVEIKYTSRTGGMSGYTTTAVGNKRLSIITAPGAATGNLSTLWGDFGMDVIPSGPCVNPPTPGTVSSSAAVACIGVPFTLSSVGGTNGSGQTYQWQISTDNLSWTDIPGATDPFLNTSQLVSNYYRLVTTCGVSVNSNAVQVLTPAAVSGTYTINNALPTGGTNFASFNDAYDYIKCGISGPVIFNVDAASGPYTEQLNMIEVPGASAINTVTFNGNGRSIEFASTNTNERAVIKLNGADHIKFDNLVINATGTTTSEYGFAVHLTNDADSNAITNCIINSNTSLTSTNYAGIAMSASNTSATGTGTTLCDGNVITGNTITGGYYGITLVGSSTSAVRENIVQGNNIREFYLYGIYMTGNYASLIDSNTLSRPTRSVVSTFNGIYMTGLSTFVNITRNTISDPFGGAPTSTSLFNGIFLTGVDALTGIENKVINNKIYNISGTGEANGINITGSDNVLVQHNTILMDGPGSSGTALTRGFYQTTLAAGITFENNIVSIRRGGSGAKYALYHNTTTSDILSNRNDLYLNSPDGNTFIGYYGGAQATLTDWQTASGGDDLNSVISSPFFANAAAGDLTPTNAGIDNLGTPLGVLIDITGAARSATTPDLGAYEFTPGNCSAPATPGDAMVNQPIVCENTVVQFSLIGNSTGLGQTYQWQFASTIAGPYTNIGTAANNSGFTTAATGTLYYRAAVTCSGITEYSTPVLLTVNPALPAGTYTINKTQPTAGTNYNSFADAGIALQCGIAGPVVFNVVAATGPYNEQFILGSIAGTSATNTITFNGNGNTIAYSSDVTGERAVVKLRDADHIIFDSLTIDATGSGTYGFGVHLINDADSNTFNNCTVLASTTGTTSNFAGMVISGSETSATGTGSLCDGNTFSNNRVYGGYYGITVVGLTSALSEGNKVIGNTVEDYYFYGVYTAGGNNTLVERNDLGRPTRTTTTTFYGVYSTGVQQGLHISKNRIHAPFAANTGSTSIFYGIYTTGTDADAATPTIVSNNLIYDVKTSGTQYGIYNASTDNINYYHNTISLDDADNTATSVTYGFYQTTLSEGINFKNNIIKISRAGTGNKVALYFATATSTIVSDNNVLYTSGTSAYTGYNGTLQPNLLAWQAAASQDANSLALQPVFSSPNTGNLSPLNPVIDNAGTPVGITTDILNAPRSATTPDIGAYEFSIPPCTAPPAAGGATAIPNSGICMGTPVELSLAGYNIGAGQTFQWEFSINAGGPWSPLGGARIFPDTTIISSGTFYYRCAVTCSGNTSFSTPVLVTLNPAFLAGTYTINSTIPASAVNFTSFASAVAALECGITGPVFFDVAANTYNEQIRMHHVAGTSPTVRVTFRSANGDPASVILTNNATLAADNYTLKLDSASYITYQNMTINATNTSNGRVVELANTASFDSIVNCIINAPVTTGTTNTSAGIFADLLKGSGNVIRGNTVNNGNIGINLEGTSTTNLTYDHVIDSNTVNGSYYYGMYLGTNGRIKVNKNTVNVTMPRNTTNYGIYNTSSDSAYQFTANKILISGITSTTTYGMYFTGCDGGENTRGKIAGNTITGLTGNTGTLYGMYQTASTFNNTVNNVISISTTGATAYGSYYTGGGGVRFQNNSIQNASTSTGTANAAAYFAQTSGTNPAINIQNNIFSHTGAGNAVYITNLNFIYSDYNTYYTASAPLFRNTTTVTYATLPLWVDFSYWDVNSINYQPKLTDNISLRPDVADPDVWAIHGRGTQIAGNDYDFDNNPRPTTFTAGVPDMGAYEFLPTSLPTLLTATPAAPAPGTTQTFMYGTDTVAKITYDAAAPVPASINLRRYSGVLPTGLSTGQQSMYFYTDIDVPAQGAYKYKVEQFYIDPWRGFIPTEAQVQLGKTDATNAWVVQPDATTDVYMNVMADTGKVYMDRFTGLTGNPPNTGAVYTTVIDSSNRGTRFWVPYGHHYSMNTNGQDMWLYLSAQDSANVTVRINGTNWVRTYHIPANTVRVSDLIPKYGLIDARIDNEGLYEHGVSIVSDVPIVAYAHIYDGATSGATMLLPVGVYGYEYQSLNASQYYSSTSYSWMSVMTDRDSALVEITPSVTTRSGRPAGVPFTITLMKGQVYNIMGTVSGSTGTDLSGTKVKSIANASGNCYPIAVFSGSSRTAICNTTNGDNLIQQVFPNQAWGRKYLAFASANSTSNTLYNSNLFRVMVKDPSTVVSKNGVVLNPSTLVVPGNYYEFSTTQGDGANGAIYIEADKPVMVGQYQVSTGANSCPGVTATGNGDPEMIYISPIEQGIKHAAFYNTNQSAITSNYVNIVIPTAGLASLRIDGTVSTFTDVFAHPFLSGYSCVRHNLGAAASQHTVASDSAFTAITYGLGSVESYGYNAGTLVKNLNALATISNTLGTGTTSDYTCVNAPFRFSILISSKPTILTWKFSAIPQLSPNADSIQTNPTPADSSFINNRWFYRFEVQGNFTFSEAGTFYVPILVTDPVSIEGCNSTLEIILPVRVIPAPVIDFAAAAVCLGNVTSFTGTGTTSNAVPINTWNWAFGDNSTGTGQNTTHTYATAGTFNATFSLVAEDGCIADTTKEVVVNPNPVVAVVEDSLVVCGASPATFTVQNPVAGVTYNWYDAPAGGTLVATGNTYTIPSVLGTTVLYVEPISGGGSCVGSRVRVIATLLPDLATPVAVVDSLGVDRIRFRWDAIPNALTYEVSINGGSSWITPSSGATGLTHTVTGLLPLTDVTLRVRAIGSATCQVATSTDVTGKTLPDDIYIPNAFSPNGDGLNDVLLVYGYTIKSLRFVVFNQWGEKVFESYNQATGWNGDYKGKRQPSGVYMYVCEMILNDGTKKVKKGSVNLVK